ncbi:M42 family metallopeptidase [Paenibacillus mendelii]|uniref:M42 family metallopeptidase n=1 Tax=Paenibacillus mendelii TaxID=206163 RepID=A0ABV6JFM8_9BACL|nr:M42 family metallopeptidase [Paenibacillus mendelii]MCQ6557551.1 M42 family metallopeptidase [Paenibacillus mendelii]
MRQETMEMFRILTELPGTSGYEDEVRRYVRAQLEQHTEEIVMDRLGSIFGVLRGDNAGPKVMVNGHMDEVGFMVTKITDNGMLKFQTLGGWWSQVLLAQRVEICTKDGRIPGVIGSTPPHLLEESQRSKPVEITAMFIDIGADSREHAIEMGVKPGLSIVPVCPFTPLAEGKKIMAKAWDNRFGVGLALELIKELKNASLPNVLYAGATVQEEVGLRGAQTAAALIQPDICYTLDAGPANDASGDKTAFGQIGGGTLIRILDSSIVPNRKLMEFILDTAETNRIPYQYFISPGATDAGRVHLSGQGVPTAALGICARYIHTSASMIHTDDYDAAKELMIQLIKQTDHSLLKTVTSFA